MAKITDLDSLVLTFSAGDLGTSADILIDTSTPRIRMAPGFSIDAEDGVSFQALYSFLVFSWQYRVKALFSSTTTAGAATGTVRLNNASIASVTNIYVSETDASTTPKSRANILGTIASGQRIEVLLATSSWDVNVSAKATFTVSGSVTDDGTYRTIPVTYVSHTGSFSNGNNVLLSPASPFAGYDFPVQSISANSGEYIIQQTATSAWDFTNDTTRNLLRDGGWQLIDSSGTVLEEWMNITSLGVLPGDLQPFFWQVNSNTATTTNTVRPAAVNQPVKIFGGPSNGNFNYKSFFRIAAKKQAQTPVVVDLLTELALTTLTARIFTFPLSTLTDLKISVADTGIDANADNTADVAPYSGIAISWGTASVDVGDGGGSQPYNRAVIDANGATLQQVHEWAAWLVRRPGDIDPGAGTRNGALEAALTRYLGDRLITAQGIAIVDYTPIDVNNINSEVTFTDSNGVSRTPLNPDFVSQLTLIFNDVLIASANAEYWVYLDEDYGTADNALVLNNSGAPMTGLVDGDSSVTLTYGYDTNTQKGRTVGTNTDIVIVAIGAGGAQWFKTTGTITRSTTLEFRLTNQTDRNYVDAA